MLDLDVLLGELNRKRLTNNPVKDINISNMYKKYKKKPVVIEAIQWDGKNLVDVSAFLYNKTRKEALKEINSSDISCKIWDDYESIIIREGLTIDTLKGKMKADIGDYIIKGINGEFYPCKPDIFAKTYEEVTE